MRLCFGPPCGSGSGLCFTIGCLGECDVCSPCCAEGHVEVKPNAAPDCSISKKFPSIFKNCKSNQQQFFSIFGCISVESLFHIDFFLQILSPVICFHFLAEFAFYRISVFGCCNGFLDWLYWRYGITPHNERHHTLGQTVTRLATPPRRNNIHHSIPTHVFFLLSRLLLSPLGNTLPAALVPDACPHQPVRPARSWGSCGMERPPGTQHVESHHFNGLQVGYSGVL